MRTSKQRSRSKSNRPRTMGNITNRVFESSGPDGKVRGTPQQIIDKYLLLARDAQLSNDRVVAEGLLQHAEHYTRMLAEAQREQQREQETRRGDGSEWQGGQNDGDQPDAPATGFRNDDQNDQERGQNDRNQNDRNQNDRNQNDRNQNDRSQNDRNQNDRNQNDRNQNDRNQNDRNQNDRNQNDRNQNDRGQGGRNQNDRRQNERNQNDRPHDDQRSQGQENDGRDDGARRYEDRRPVSADRPRAYSEQDAQPRPGGDTPRTAFYDVIDLDNTGNEETGLIETPEATSIAPRSARRRKPAAEAIAVAAEPVQEAPKPARRKPAPRKPRAEAAPEEGSAGSEAKPRTASAAE